MKPKLLYTLLFILSCFCISYGQTIEIGSPANLTECFQSPTEGFDLALNDENVLDGLSSDLYTVYYFDNQLDSNNNQITNSISNPSNYSTGSFGLTQIWVNVVENADETNFDNSTFLLITNETPVANSPGFNFFGIPVPHYIDCESGSTYDLTFLDDSIIGDQEGDFIVTYFENEQDANNNVNAISNPENYDLQSNVNTVFTTDLVARIQFDDDSSCFNTTSFTFSTYQSNNNDFDSMDITKCANDDGTAVFDLTETFVVNNNNLDISNRNYDVYDEDGNQIGSSIFNEENYPTNTFEELSIEIRNVIRLNPNITGFCVNIEAFTIQAFENPQVENVQDIVACSQDDEEIVFDITQNDALAIGNQTGNYTISYHFTLPEANAGINSVVDAGFDPTEFTLDNFQQFLFLRIENADEPSCFSVDFFTLQDAGNLTALAPENTDFCSLVDEDTLSIDLTDFDDDIKGNQMSDALVVAYFEDDTLIDDPTDFLLQNELTTITAVLSLSDEENCSDEVEFDVFLFQSPEIQNLNDLEACSDFDFTSTFDLTENITEAIGTQDETEIEVSFFTSLADAENNDNSLTEQEIDTTEYPVFAETETIFIRLQNQDSADCFVVGFFELLSFPTEINEVADLVQCTEEGVTPAIFDLTQIESDFFPDEAEASDFSIAYFDENEAQITDVEAYEITTAETILVEITNLNNLECMASTNFNLSFNVTPEIQNLNDLEVCSDFDFTSTFNLTENIPEAIGTQDETEIEVSFFTSLADAENNDNSLTEQEIDTTEYPVFAEVETIFIRLQNQDSADCFVVGSFELLSFPTEINEVEDLVQCTEEGVASAIFDFTQIESDLFLDEAEASDFSIAYFDENEAQITDFEAYEITTAETISVEITNLNNSECVASTNFNLSFNVTPEIQNLNNLEVCSDFDFTATFDLTENIPEAIGTQDETEIEVSFFTSLPDAENNQNSLAEQELNPTEYPVFAEAETIFIRLQNQDSTDCFVVSSFELLSFPIEANPIENLVECLDAESGLASFDLSVIPSLVTSSSENLNELEVNVFNENNDLLDISQVYETATDENLFIEVSNLANPDCLATTSVLLEVLPVDDEACTLSIISEEDLAFKVYPNPFTNSLNISSKQPIIQATIFDIQGKKVFEEQANNLQKLNLSRLPSGFYIAQFQSEDVMLIRKIVKP